MLEIGLREGECRTWRRPFAFMYDLDRKLIASQFAGLGIFFQIRPKTDTIMRLRDPKWWELRISVYLWGILSLVVVIPIWKYRGDGRPEQARRPNA